MKKNKYLLISFGLTLFIIFFYFGIIRKTAITIYETTKKLSQMNKELYEAKKESASISDVIATAKNTEEKVLFYKNYLSPHDFPNEFFMRLDKIGQKTGIKFTGIVSVEEKEKKIIKTLLYDRQKYEIHVVGGFHQIYYFISQLENLDRFVIVESFKILPTQDIFNQQARIIVSLYYLKEQL